MSNRTAALNSPPNQPVDVRLMKWAASLLLGLFALMLIAALLAWLIRLPQFNLKSLTVAGDLEHNSDLTLRPYVLLGVQGDFFTVNLSTLKASLEKAPWVRRATVVRAFPNQLQVHLEEHRAVAQWGAEGQSTLLNGFGEVFDAGLDDWSDAGLPRLSGPQEQALEILNMYKALAPEFKKIDLKINELELSGRGSWRVVLENDARIELGQGGFEDILGRVNRLALTLKDVAARYGRKSSYLEYADLRHPDGYAIRLRGVTTINSELKK